MLMLAGAVALIPGAPNRQRPESMVEMVAIRALLASYTPGRVIIDSLFAVADQAPPAMTTRARPPARQRLLVDSLVTLQVRGGLDTLHVRASEPQIRGDSATICVTVDSRSVGGGKYRSYETVAFVLQRDGSRWLIRGRTQLGVS
jgi:hypothetical protein